MVVLNLNNKYMLAIAIRSIRDTSVTIVSLNHVMAPCVLGVWFDCISVVLTTVRASATPDPKVDKQTDIGNRLFSKTVSVRRVVVERADAHSCCGAE